MKTADLTVIRNLMCFSFRIKRKYILIWAAALFSIMFLYMILFPVIKDIAEVKLELMPDEMLQFVGMNSLADMGNYTAYFSMIYNLLLIVMSIFSAILASSLLSGDENKKTAEFIHALEVSRTEIFLSRIVASYISLIFVVFSVGPVCNDMRICRRRRYI